MHVGGVGVMLGVGVMVGIGVIVGVGVKVAHAPPTHTAFATGFVQKPGALMQGTP